MKNRVFKLKVFVLLIFYNSGYGQITNFIYALNNTSSGTFYFSKIEIATGVITNLQIVSTNGVFTDGSATIDNNSQKYYFCTDTSLITLDALSGSILSTVLLPIPQGTQLWLIQFNPCDSDIYGILNNYPSSISLVRYNISTNTISTVASLNPGNFICTDCGSFLDPVNNVYVYRDIFNLNGLTISNGQVIYNSPVNDLPNESFENLTVKCSTHEIFGTSTNYNTGIKYLATLNPNTGNVTHVSNIGWTTGLLTLAGSGELINQLTGDYFYVAGDTLVGANTMTGNMSYNHTINSGDLYFIQHFSQCSCGPNQINSLNDDKKRILYPNPSDGNFIIYFNNDISEKTIQIFDITGNIIYQKDEIKTSEQEVDLTLQPKGVYFLKVFEKDKISVNKIVLQ